MGDANVNFCKESGNKELKTLLISKGYKQLITKPIRITKESSTIIDIITSTPADGNPLSIFYQEP